MTIVSTSMLLGSMLWAERLLRLIAAGNCSPAGPVTRDRSRSAFRGGGEEASEGQGEGWEEASRTVAIEPLRFLVFVSA